MTPEQLLIIAREVARLHPNATVRSFGCLATAAAAPSARISGIAVYASSREAAEALHDAILALRPLHAHNELLAAVAQDVYLRRHAHEG